MPATMKGAISFGLLHVPISLHTATQDNDISFHQLCREDGSRVRYKKVCAGCGKEVSGDGIVKGFEIEPGRYVTLTDEDFEKAKAEKDRTIHILHFADIQDIRPIYFDKTYHTIPEAGGDKAYNWYVMEDCNTAYATFTDGLSLDEAIQRYTASEYDDKRLGVTKDDIAAVDLVIRHDGREWVSEDWTKSESFAQDPTVADAVTRMRQLLENQAPAQGMTMGGLN